MAVSPDGNMVVAVYPDSDSITIVDTSGLNVLAEVSVGDNPTTLSILPTSQQVVVANRDSGTVSLVDLVNLEELVQWPAGAMPYGVVTDGSVAYVTDFALGTVNLIDIATGDLTGQIRVDPFPSGLALDMASQRVYVTHFFTGAVTVIDIAQLNVVEVISTGGDTNLSQYVAISSDGARAYLPQTRSNVTNTARLFDTTVFPVVNVLDLKNFRLLVRERITLDTADVPVNNPFSVAISPDGGTLFLANAGSDDVSIIDLGTNAGVGHVPVGVNPRGIAIHPDGSRVFVNNTLDGTLSVIDTDSITVVNTVSLTDIPLSPTVLLGKKIFNSASEPLLTTDNWISCATCHFDGMMDGRTWLRFPDGPRNTPSLFGVAETLPIHWSGDLDELQDVEITIRDIQFGEGLIDGKAHDSLGTAHAGLSIELDALVAYLTTLTMAPSPFANDTEGIDRGETIFMDKGCVGCHVPPLYTDLELHDIGTGDPEVERNSHGRGTSFDTPTLRGLWLTAPYLHDGSAASLGDVLRIGNESHDIGGKLSDDELEDLITFLLALPIDE